MAYDSNTRFSEFCTYLLKHMKINRKQLFLALFEWTDNSPNYFSDNAFYPFIRGDRPLPDVFENAFSIVPDSYKKARNSISNKFLKHIKKDCELRKELITFIEKEISLSPPIKKYLLKDCENDAATFYTCIFYMVLTGNQQLPPLKHNKEFKSILLTNIPAPSPFFLGRENELDEINTTLDTYGICYVWGISGIGKSDLVCKYAKVKKSKYSNIVYIRFHQSIETSIAMLTQPASSDGYTVAERFQMNSKIINTFGKDTLVILDNFDVYAENDPHFSWLMGCDFDLLITSRMKPVDIPAVHIKELSITQAAKLFKVHCQTSECSITTEQIQDICEKTKCHTLVTILVAKALTYTELTVSDVIEALNKSLATLPSETKISLSKDATVKTELYSNFIAELFNFANLNRPEKMLLCMIAVMPLDGITNAQFLSYTGEKTLDVINKYVRLGYIERGRNNNISMHPLIADTCIGSLSEVTRYAIKEVLSNFLFEVYAQKEYPSVEEQLIAVSICEVILQHQEYELTQEMIDLTSFFTKCGQYLHTVDTTEYVISHQSGLTENEKDYSVALSSYYKGLALIQLGDNQTAKHSFEDTINILGQKDNFSLNEAELFFNAVIEHAACEEDPALCIKKLEEIHIDGECLPNDNHQMLLSRIAFKIASTYLTLEEYEKAKELFNESLRIRNQILGPESISSGLALGNIAYSFQKMGEYVVAAEYYELGISILSKHYPKNHMNLIRMHINCATAYQCAKPASKYKLLAELHFDLAKESADEVVVENRFSKKEWNFESLLGFKNIHPLPNHEIRLGDSPLAEFMAFSLYNNPYSLSELEEKFHDTYHPHGESDIYMTDFLSRTKKQFKKSKKSKK